MSDDTLQPGQVIEETYRIVRRIGAGGMGEERSSPARPWSMAPALLVEQPDRRRRSLNENRGRAVRRRREERWATKSSQYAQPALDVADNSERWTVRGKWPRLGRVPGSHALAPGASSTRAGSPKRQRFIRCSSSTFSPSSKSGPTSLHCHFPTTSLGANFSEERSRLTRCVLATTPLSASSP